MARHRQHLATSFTLFVHALVFMFTAWLERVSVYTKKSVSVECHFVLFVVSKLVGWLVGRSFDLIELFNKLALSLSQAGKVCTAMAVYSCTHYTLAN